MVCVVVYNWFASGRPKTTKYAAKDGKKEGKMFVKVSELKEHEYVILLPKVWGSGEYVLNRVYIDQGSTPQEELVELVVGENYETLVFTSETAKLLCEERGFVLLENVKEFLKAVALPRK